MCSNAALYVLETNVLYCSTGGVGGSLVMYSNVQHCTYNVRC
jgi:hypothetical protein